MPDQKDHSEPLSDRLKEFSEEQFGHLEQEPPNKPSFLFVVLLFGVALIVIFLIAIFVLHLDRGRLFRRPPQHPDSQLILPAPSPQTQLA